MKKKVFFTIALAILLAVPLGSAFAYEALIGSTGVLQWDKTATADGDHILVTSSAWKNSYLIDREGYIINEWKTNSNPGAHDLLLKNGNLLRGFTPTVDNDGKPIPASWNIPIGGAAGGVQEFDWNGKLVWQYIAKTADKCQHHTFFRMENGHTLILLWEKIPAAAALAAGRDPAIMPANGVGLYPDMIEEVDETPYPGIPQVVRRWRVWDHIVQDRIPSAPNYSANAATDRTRYNLNYATPNPFGHQDWTHANTVTHNPKTNEVITNFRQWGMVSVIDWSDGPTFGNIKAKFGNPCSYGAGRCPAFFDDGDTYLWGSHNATFLDNGNYLVFDNGWARPSGNLSRVVEIDPTKADNKNAIVWSYQSADQSSFFTTFQGGCSRLPNGNTFITSTDGAHLFEVTPAKKVVWEFILPPRAGTDINDKATCTMRDVVPTNVHRANVYNAYTYPGLQGKDLSRKGHIALGCPEMWKLWDTPFGEVPSVLTGFGFGPIGGGGGGGGTGGSGGGSGGY
jgi:hypothetical protein